MGSVPTPADPHRDRSHGTLLDAASDLIVSGGAVTTEPVETVPVPVPRQEEKVQVDAMTAEAVSALDRDPAVARLAGPVVLARLAGLAVLARALVVRPHSDTEIDIDIEGMGHEFLLARLPEDDR